VSPPNRSRIPIAGLFQAAFPWSTKSGGWWTYQFIPICYEERKKNFTFSTDIHVKQYRDNISGAENLSKNLSIL